MFRHERRKEMARQLSEDAQDLRENALEKIVQAVEGYHRENPEFTDDDTRMVYASLSKLFKVAADNAAFGGTKAANDFLLSAAKRV